MRGRVSILPRAKSCPECGVEMEWGQSWHGELKDWVKSYECPDCGYAEVREDLDLP